MISGRWWLVEGSGGFGLGWLWLDVDGLREWIRRLRDAYEAQVGIAGLGRWHQNVNRLLIGDIVGLAVGKGPLKHGEVGKIVKIIENIR